MMDALSSRRRHTRSLRDWSSDVCSSDLNNVDLDTQLRIANVSNSQATVTVTIGDVSQPSFNLAAGASTRVSYPVNNGPVKIVSTRNIVARSEERRVGKECRA